MHLSPGPTGAIGFHRAIREPRGVYVWEGKASAHLRRARLGKVGERSSANFPGKRRENLLSGASDRFAVQTLYLLMEHFPIFL